MITVKEAYTYKEWLWEAEMHEAQVQKKLKTRSLCIRSFNATGCITKQVLTFTELRE